MGGRKSKKTARKGSTASKKRSKAQSKPQKSPSEDPKKVRAKAPPHWYLWAIIILNIFGVIADYFILNGHKSAGILTEIENSITPIWLALCVALIIHLWRKKATAGAFFLPLYYIVFFITMYGIAYYLTMKGVFINQETLITTVKWIVGVTTVFEIGVSGYFLKRK